MRMLILHHLMMNESEESEKRRFGRRDRNADYHDKKSEHGFSHNGLEIFSEVSRCVILV
jgi:hypothetical protein